MSAGSDEKSGLAPLRKALLTIERLEAELLRRSARAREPVAIRSAALRLPGGVRDLDGLGRLLWSGVDASGELPSERWNVDELYDVRPEARGKIYTRRGSFLERVDGFDASFFGISPREALHIDPQQRLLLELAWEAIERAGIAPDSLRGTRTGVFVGIGIGDWGTRLMRAGNLSEVDAYTGIGTGFAFAAGRVAFHLGLQGPTMSVDTACSSSLVALHLACQSLRAGECDLALVGGVHLMLAPETMVVLSRTGALSPDGRCKTFDARADGYGRGEGAAMILLSRNRDLPREAPPLLGLVRGSAVNHDGPSSALTVPNGPAQEAVLKSALVSAGVSADEIGYVEAHGTGTQLGDPMEVSALAAVFGQERSAPLRIGSLKTNIGHLEAAAGLAGLLKLCLVLSRAEIPPHLHLTRKTPHVAWDKLAIEVPTTLTPWSAGRPLLGGVSAFGLSGTNAHAIVERAPPRASVAEGKVGRAELLVLSARTRTALGELASAVAGQIRAEKDVPLGQLAYSLSACRALQAERVALVASSHEELARALEERAQTRVSSRAPLPLAFLFTGQGSPYPGMGRELFGEEPAFRSVIEACDEIAVEARLRVLPSAAVRGEVDAASLTDTAHAQPALFALQAALSALWRSWGITPSFVVGHSVGEIAAAYVAGALSLEDGMRFAIERGRAMGALPKGGAMVSVRADRARVEPLLAGQRAVSLAAHNAPGQTVIAGERAAVQAVVGALERQGVAAIPLTVSHAFHSPLMDPALDAIGRAAPPSLVPTLSFVSTLTGGSWNAAFDGKYWRDQARGAVRFVDAVQCAWAEGARTFVEIGPRPTLLALTKSSVAQAELLLPSLKPGTPERQVMRSALAALIEGGERATLSDVFADSARRYVQVPSYPFEHERFWVDWVGENQGAPESSASVRGISGRESRHLLLGPGVRLASNDMVFSILLSDQGLLAEHRIGGRAVVPMSALIDALVSALVCAFPGAQVALDSLELRRPLFLPAGEPQELELVVSPRGAARAAVTVRARDPESSAEFSEVAVASAALDAAQPAGQQRSLDTLRQRAGTAVPLEQLFAGLAARGVELGADYRAFAGALRAPGELFAQLVTPRPHWTALDAAVQAVGMAALDGEHETLLFPSTVGACRIGDLSRAEWVHARAERKADGSVLGHAELLDARGEVVVALSELRLLPGSLAAFTRAFDAQVLGLAHELCFRELPAQETTLAPGRWLMFSEGGAVSVALRRALLDGGSQVVQVFPGARAREIEPGLHELDPRDEQAYVSLLARAREQLNGALDGILYLWGQQEQSADGAELALNGALSVVRALARSDQLTRLVLITRGAQPVQGKADHLAVFQSPLWGLGRALQVEQPELSLQLLDLDPTSLAQHGAALVRALGESENQLAFRDGKAHAARLVEVAQETRSRLLHAPTLQLSPDATYLVTGGFGGLGLSVVSWLIERGARHVEVLSRRGAGDDARELQHAWQRAGADVRAHICDVSDRAALARTLQLIEADGLLVRGVVHAAAVIDDALVNEQHAGRLSAVLAAKLRGTLHLHELLEGRELDLFFCFSSLVSLMGSAGQTNYAAANAFVDALCALRRARGKAATCVQWGPWAGRGSAQILADQRRWGELGLGKIAPSLGLRAIALTVTAQIDNLCILPISWERFFSRIPRDATPPLYAELRAKYEATQVPVRARDEALIKRLADAGSSEARTPILLAHLQREAMQVLRLGSSDALTPTRPLNELGFDSLLAVELRNAVQQSLGLTIKVSALFEHPTLLGLAEYLARDGQMKHTPARVPVSRAPVVTTRAVHAAAIDLSLIYFASGTSGPDDDKYRHVLAQARLADTAGFKAIWIPERHFFEFGALYPEPSLLAAALATVTRRIRLRAGSVVVPLHHPLQLAERWAMVDNLSGGRVDLSVATGWSPLDFVFAPANYADRLNVMRQGVDTLMRLWRGERVALLDGNGQHSEVRAFPRPVQRELALWYTCSGGLARFEEAGRAGANVLTALLFQTYDQLAEKIAAYRRARAEAGHDPSTGVVTLMLHAFVDDDEASVISAIREPFIAYLESTAKVWLEASSSDKVESVEKLSAEERADVLEMAFRRYVHTAGLFGTPEACRGRLAELAHMGVNEVACLVDFGVAPERVEHSLRKLATLLAGQEAYEREELVL